MEIELVPDVIRRNRLRWLGHLLRKDDGDWVKKCMSLEVFRSLNSCAYTDV